MLEKNGELLSQYCQKTKHNNFEIVDEEKEHGDEWNDFIKTRSINNQQLIFFKIMVSL